MLLAVDIGNTETHLGIFEENELTHEWRASTDGRRTSDELALLFGQFMALVDLSLSKDVTGISVCSVVPRATQEIREMADRYLGFPAVVVEAGTRTGIAVHTENPREVGADRIANAVAAHHLFPDSSAVVVDFGTAITVDVVSAKGEYLGGAIAPGLDTSASALFSATAQIGRVALVAPESVIGKTTVSSVQSGIMYGTAALVDGLVDKVRAELGDTAEVIATGGLAGTVVRHCATIERVEPALTLMGLRLVYQRNTEGS
jgi:type III pantothenate kinase